MKRGWIVLAAALILTILVAAAPQPQEKCTSSWSCSPWTPCEGDHEKRICSDINECTQSFNKPKETRRCLPEILTRNTIPVEMSGNAECIGKHLEAIQLLADKAPNHLRDFFEYVGVLRCVEQGSGTFVFEQPIRVDIAEHQLGISTTWLASVLAHEACHAKQYTDYKRRHPARFMVPDEAYSGQEAEADCLDQQFDALQKMDAPKRELDRIPEAFHEHYWDVSQEDRWW